MAENYLDLEKMSEQYFDVLKEIGNIGAGNATTALAQLLQCKVDMKVPQVKLLEFQKVGAEMGSEEMIMAGIYLAVEGDITGSIMCCKNLVAQTILFTFFGIWKLLHIFLILCTDGFFGNYPVTVKDICTFVK